MKGLMEWGRLISITGSAQILVQVLGLLSGILIIRMLSTQEFALYTLANSMLAVCTVIVDSGTGAGLLSTGGRSWNNREELGRVVVTGINLRRGFSFFVLLSTMPVLVYLLLHHGAGWLAALLIVLALIPSFYAGLSDSIYEIPLKLNQDLMGLQKNQISAGISRLLLILATLYFLPFTLVAICCGSVSRFWANIRLRKRAHLFADLDQREDAGVRKDIISILSRTLPSTIYYCASSQIAIWLVSIFGNTTSIAQVGALEKTTSGLALINVIFMTLVVPRFARLPQGSALLNLRFLQILCALLLVDGMLCCAFYFFSDEVLSVLGPKYGGLNLSLLLITISASLSSTAGMVNFLSVSRGWAISPLIHIPVCLIAQIALIYCLDMKVLNQVLLFSIANALVVLFLFCGNFFFMGMRSSTISYTLQK